MVREIFKTDAGILFLTDRLYEIGLDPSTIHPVVQKRPDHLPVGDEKIREPCHDERATRPPMYKAWEKLPPTRRPLKTGPDAMSRSEEDEELKDALSPVFDEMCIKKWWWYFVEILPLPLSRQWHGLCWSTRVWSVAIGFLSLNVSK
jgi:hypothetical protein